MSNTTASPFKLCPTTRFHFIRFNFTSITSTHRPHDSSQCRWMKLKFNWQKCLHETVECPSLLRSNQHSIIRFYAMHSRASNLQTIRWLKFFFVIFGFYTECSLYNQIHLIFRIFFKANQFSFFFCEFVRLDHLQCRKSSLFSIWKAAIISLAWRTLLLWCQLIKQYN